MAKDNMQSQGGQSAEDKALERFADLMIEKIENIKGDWKKPWFSEVGNRWPKNLSGREYNGMNAVMLSLQAEKQGYHLPVWATFDRINHMNFTKDKEGKWQYGAKDGEGKNLPHVGVNKGEKSFPVFINVFSVVNTETKERIKYDDYKQMSEEERAKYKVYPKLQVYNVFSVDQTNLKEARPELYAKLEEQNSVNRPQQNGDTFSFEPVDKMIKDDLWVCPIKEVHGDDAYYSISKREIVVPEREQFYERESFYSNLFHEMSHSTGAEGLLNRLKPSSFGSQQYAREELVAEVSAALTASRYGMTKNIKEDSAAYLKNWLDSLHENPDFIKTTLLDVKRASSMISQRVDKIQLALSEGREIDRSEFITQDKTKGNSESVIDGKAATKANSVNRQNEQSVSETESKQQEQQVQEVAKHGRGR